ncbi:hypothetical protein CXT76_02600 [Candidatus Parvarchaeota archaeon]|nr:MAG: hypothetical protein CXT76_02600 [Candidatus Parvarchaeota archaeon]
MNVEILTLAKEKKMLLGKDILNFLENFEPSKVKEFLENIKDNLSPLKILLNNLTEKQKISLEPFLNKLGLKLTQLEKNKIEKKKEGFSIHYSPTIISEELKVKDFVNHFRSRYHQLQKILIHKNNFPNLVSIDKLSRNRQNITLIGIVTEKRLTKNENLMIVLKILQRFF